VYPVTSPSDATDMEPPVTSTVDALDTLTPPITPITLITPRPDEIGGSE
jgi:hypothetical protein